jgi:hypothetical protein
MKGYRKPTTLINLVAAALSGFILTTILIEVFKLSEFMGFMVLVIYALLGIFAYRAAHVHTRANRENQDHDQMARDGRMSAKEYQERYPNG